MNDIQEVQVSDKELFSLTFEKLANTADVNLYLSREYLTSELYVHQEQEVQTHQVKLESHQKENTHELKVYQNAPNPFDESTTITFLQPAEGMTTFRVLDITGKLLLQRSENYSSGIHQIRLTAAELQAQGILYYQLESGNQIVTRRMVVLK